MNPEETIAVLAEAIDLLDETLGDWAGVDETYLPERLINVSRARGILDDLAKELLGSIVTENGGAQ